MPFGTLGAFLLAGSGLVPLTLLVLDLIGVLHRGTGFRWFSTGMVIMIASENSAIHDWTGSWAGVVETATLLVLAAGFVIFVRGAVILERERRKARRAG